jgi:hypothetical protein
VSQNKAAIDWTFAGEWPKQQHKVLSFVSYGKNLRALLISPEGFSL